MKGMSIGFIVLVSLAAKMIIKRRCEMTLWVKGDRHCHPTGHYSNWMLKGIILIVVSRYVLKFTDMNIQKYINRQEKGRSTSFPGKSFHCALQEKFFFIITQSSMNFFSHFLVQACKKAIQSRISIVWVLVTWRDEFSIFTVRKGNVEVNYEI
mgnify:CR=1 FL=1